MAEIIVVGDRTSHGGVVIQGTPTSDIAGKLIARIGDKVTCPLPGHGGVTVIATGDPTLIIDGAAVARHGDKTACGAVLLCSQVTTTDSPGGGGSGGGAGAAGGGGAASSLGAASGGGGSGSGAVAGTASAGTSTNPGAPSASSAPAGATPAAANTATKYDMHFLLKDKNTGAPLAGLPYRITLASGEEVTGTTDKTGHTQKVKSDSAEVAKLEAPYYGDSTSSSNTHDGHDACCS
jgi:uncharacterized Zn-binding protein involved in type VI secretion